VKRDSLKCSVGLDGKYRLGDICLGVPVIIGKNGWEKIVDYKLNGQGQESLIKLQMR
jgi:malate dehydrogenase